LLFRSLSSNIPANNATKMMISVKPATQTTVIVTAVLNSSCCLLPGRFMEAKLYQILTLEQVCCGMRGKTEPGSEQRADQDYPDNQDHQSNRNGPGHRNRVLILVLVFHAV
jgi:hypothetical protein